MTLSVRLYADNLWHVTEPAQVNKLSKYQ